MNGRHGLRLARAGAAVLLGLIGMHALIAPAAPCHQRISTAAGRSSPVHRPRGSGPTGQSQRPPVTTGHEQPPAGLRRSRCRSPAAPVPGGAGRRQARALSRRWLFLDRLALPSSAAPASTGVAASPRRDHRPSRDDSPSSVLPRT
ncbi:hypothetical protein HBB16_15040 [Pseudonocardia sp. MCCB 268]|nr:hypothetical protein [Pseudonocardia cytotoxica]